MQVNGSDYLFSVRILLARHPNKGLNKSKRGIENGLQGFVLNIERNKMNEIGN